MSCVIVIGSINRDITVTADRFLNPGEALSGTSLTYGLGGKGASRTAAVAYSGVPVFFVGAVGADPSGQYLRAGLASHGVNVTHLREISESSETTLITANSSGEDTIILDAGTNATVTVELARVSLLPAPTDIAILQAEISAEINAEAPAWVHSFGARILFNLTPACPTDTISMARVDVPIVNETEADLTLGMPILAGPTEAIGIAWTLRDLNLKYVMVTLGTDDAVRASGSETGHFPALTFGEAVGATGVGDACMDTLAAAMVLGKPFAEVVADSIRAGLTAILAPGAAPLCAVLPCVTHA